MEEMKGTTSISINKDNSSSISSTSNPDRAQWESKLLTLNVSPRGYLDHDVDADFTTTVHYPTSVDIYSARREESTLTNWYSPEGNTDFTPIYDPSSYERGFTTSAHVGIFLCTVGIFVNLLLFTVLVSSKKLRFQYIYVQILNIALADLSFIVTVDSFTVYFEFQSWRLGEVFCQTWIILDEALPSVSLFGLVLLNVDRIVFAYKTNLYQRLMGRKVSRIIVLLCPWFISCIIVNTLWLGFPASTGDHQPGLCMYGITQEANLASIWLTVFIPSLLIFVLLIFIFIAGIGEMPSITYSPSTQRNDNNPATFSLPTHPVKINEQDVGRATTRPGRTPAPVASSMTNILEAGRQRRFVAALLVVDFISLAITLPFSAYSQVAVNCKSYQTCQSLVTLFQILGWMKSSITCARPIFFILLTDIFLSIKRRFACLCTRHERNMDTLLQSRQQNRDCLSGSRHGNNCEKINLTEVNFRNLCSTNNSTTSTAGQSPQCSLSEQSNGVLEKQAQHNETTNVYQINETGKHGTFV